MNYNVLSKTLISPSIILFLKIYTVINVGRGSVNRQVSRGGKRKENVRKRRQKGGKY